MAIRLDAIGTMVETSGSTCSITHPPETRASTTHTVQSPAPSRPTHTRTLVVAPGLTLSASGWDDAALDDIVRAIRETITTHTGEGS